MGKKDIVSDEYLSDNDRFADLCNYSIYDGEQVIKPEDLKPLPNAESAIIQKMNELIASKKLRDIAKGVTIKRDEHVTFAVIGVENQSEIHYAMVVKNMLYDAMNYSSQVKAIEKELRKGEQPLTNAEFLSGFTKDSTICPVITIVINWSNKEWDAPVRLKSMFGDIDSRLMDAISDYEIKVIDPHKIDDFQKFHTELGDVLEFIKHQNEENYSKNLLAQKGDNWTLHRDSVNAINVFTGSKIPIDPVKKEVNMCRAIEALVEDGITKRDKEKITGMLKKGKTPEDIVEFCDYPMELVLEVQAELEKTK